MMGKRTYFSRYVILKTTSKGRGKIKSEKIATLPKLYKNMKKVMYEKIEAKVLPNDKIQVKKIIWFGNHRTLKHFFSGTVTDFIKKAEFVARKFGEHHDYLRTLKVKKSTVKKHGNDIIESWKMDEPKDYY